MVRTKSSLTKPPGRWKRKNTEKKKKKKNSTKPPFQKIVIATTLNQPIPQGRPTSLAADGQGFRQGGLLGAKVLLGKNQPRNI